MIDPKYGSLLSLSPHVRFLMIFGKNVSHLIVGKRRSHVSLPCPVFDG